MQETYYTGTYWGARRETAAECAQRAAAFLQGLAACDPSFQHWYQPGRTPRGLPGRPLPSDDLRELEAFMLRGRNRTDFGHHVIEELGFSGTFWNGRKNSALVSTVCGSSSPHTSNLCVMNLPSRGEPFERLVCASVLARVLTCMVTAWDPDWGVATSGPLRDLVSDKGRVGTFAGWLTYISRRRGTVPPLPAPARIEPVGTHGTLVILMPERPTVSTPEHVESLSRLQRLLDGAGLLTPVAQ